MKTSKIFNLISVLLLSTTSATVFAHEGHRDGNHPSEMHHQRELNGQISQPEHPWLEAEDDLELTPDFMEILACRRASSSQIAVVNQGNAKRSRFYNNCVSVTGSSKWCEQVERPNPSSRSTFNCTYGSGQVHRLIHPSESTWKHATKAIQLIQALGAKGICVSQIYNWWRPEPYNKNVGGAAGRHPFGTSVDVRFCSSGDAKRGFDELCKSRRAGQVRALGYYGGSGVHIGVGDSSGNTWGRSCG